MRTAYGLRAEYEGTVDQDGQEVPVFTGGSVTYGDGQSFDVREALDEGNGVIVVADDHAGLNLALDGFPALKRVPVPEGATALSAYSAMTVPALRDVARRRGLAGASSARKDALVAALTEQDERLRAGDTTAQASEAHPVEVTPEGDLSTPEDAGTTGEEA